MAVCGVLGQKPLVCLPNVHNMTLNSSFIPAGTSGDDGDSIVVLICLLVLSWQSPWLLGSRAQDHIAHVRQPVHGAREVQCVLVGAESATLSITGLTGLDSRPEHQQQTSNQEQRNECDWIVHDIQACGKKLDTSRTGHSSGFVIRHRQTLFPTRNHARNALSFNPWEANAALWESLCWHDLSFDSTV